MYSTVFSATLSCPNLYTILCVTFYVVLSPFSFPSILPRDFSPKIALAAAEKKKKNKAKKEKQKQKKKAAAAAAGGGDGKR